MLAVTARALEPNMSSAILGALFRNLIFYRSCAASPSPSPHLTQPRLSLPPSHPASPFPRQASRAKDRLGVAAKGASLLSRLFKILID